ncbi:MAG: flavodoxin-dependent (E)-4-hydroxy-3-methylbut-2-enyl-diphosphate synthase, partial [Bacteroidales bacterium]|nr:flavodoxin-dependent (E)-4-hydroxy-3-methylbut-2-enyl-diphosphate synthase [Bacteroidales bacterium]
SKILILDVKNKNKTAAMRFVFYKLFERKSLNPVLLAPDNGLENFSTKDYIIASECAGVFVDGFGDGICLKSNSDIVSRIELSFKILQICRLRITGNEYISCPGCGRTLYNLQDTVKKIKEATKSYKNLKIAVMGCIVNGPGEMADADYGYVGDGKNKISLYKNGKIVKKAVDEENAVEELIKLIDSLH